MRYGIFSDIHGNLQAMESVREAYRKQNIDRYFCLGDIVGYGANPHECIEEVKAMRAVSIAGNHDWAVLGKVNIDDFNPIAKEAILWTQKHLSQDDVEFVRHLALMYNDEKCILVHGTLNHPEEFEYLMDHHQAQKMFRLMDKDICFVGHTHVAGFFIKDDDAILYSSSVDIKLKEGFKYIVNVGSVGQPRDGDPQAAYCIYDTEKRTVVVKRVDYDIEEAQQRIWKAGLPPFLGIRLALGH